MERSEKKPDRSSRPNPDKRPGQDPNGGGIPPFLRFSGLAFEMLATIGLATTGGYYLDRYLALRFPAFLISFAILSLVGSLYLLYKRLPKDQ